MSTIATLAGWALVALAVIGLGVGLLAVRPTYTIPGAATATAAFVVGGWYAYDHALYLHAVILGAGASSCLALLAAHIRDHDRRRPPATLEVPVFTSRRDDLRGVTFTVELLTRQACLDLGLPVERAGRYAVVRRRDGSSVGLHDVTASRSHAYASARRATAGTMGAVLVDAPQALEAAGGAR